MANFNPRNVLKVLIDEFGLPGSDPNPFEKDVGRYLIGKLLCIRMVNN